MLTMMTGEPSLRLCLLASLLPLHVEEHSQDSMFPQFLMIIVCLTTRSLAPKRLPNVSL